MRWDDLNFYCWFHRLLPESSCFMFYRSYWYIYARIKDTCIANSLRISFYIWCEVFCCLKLQSVATQINLNELKTALPYMYCTRCTESNTWRTYFPSSWAHFDDLMAPRCLKVMKILLPKWEQKLLKWQTYDYVPQHLPRLSRLLGCFQGSTCEKEGEMYGPVLQTTGAALLFVEMGFIRWHVVSTPDKATYSGQTSQQR